MTTPPGPPLSTSQIPALPTTSVPLMAPAQQATVSSLPTGNLAPGAIVNGLPTPQPAAPMTVNWKKIAVSSLLPLMALTLVGGGCLAYKFWGHPEKVIVSLLLASSLCQVWLDFYPGKSKPIFSALCRLGPIIVAVGALLTS